MKRSLVFFFFIFLLFGALNAQETFHFRTDAPQGLSVKSSSSSGLSLHYAIQELGIADTKHGEIQGQEIILKGQFAPNGEGRPNLPVVNRYIAIPQGATLKLQVKENASTTLSDINLLPSAPLLTDFDKGLPQLRWDERIYGKDACFPTENIVLSTPTQIRSLDVVLLSITPFRYNPVKRTLEVIHDIDIDIRFEGGNGKFGESRYFNPDWEHILRNLVINNDMLPSTNYYDLIKAAQEKDEEGCEYLIIVPDNNVALAWADTLKAFRTKQGILTKIVRLSECGVATTTSIRNYILDAYNNWAIPPAAVLLFSGYKNGQGIPPFFHYTIADDYASTQYPTDYPYSDLNGDSLADIALSRVTALTEEEYQTFVTKTIQYESNPTTDENYYDHPIITSGHESNKWFMFTSQSLNGFYRNKLGKHPVNHYMMVDDYEAPDSIWSTAYNTSVMLDYFGPNGQNYIPTLLTDLHEWMDRENNAPLISALQQGSFLTLYRDHSNHNRWWCPLFDDEDVNSYNGELPTFVLSISCSTTLFTEYNKSIVDAFCTKPNGGAIGGIGAASLTYSIFNDILTWGIIDCIWPDYMPDLGSETPAEFIRPSYVLAEAKHYLGYHVFLPNWWPDKEQSTMNLFGYTGETYLNLYTETPQTLQIAHGLFQPTGTNEYIVNAEEGTVICLTIDGEIFDIAKSEGQAITFILPDLAEGEHFTLTATKQNRIRYEQVVTIIPSSGSFVAIDKDGIIIENEFNTLHNGENAHLGLILHNYGNSTAANTTMELTCHSPYIEITQGSNQYSNMAPNQAVTIDHAFQFKIADDTPDMTEVAFLIRINDGNNIREYEYTQTIVAPLIMIKPDISFVDNNRHPILQIANEGITDIHIQIANEGHFDSKPVNLQFEIPAPFISIIDPNRMFNTLEKGSTMNVVFKANAHNSTIEEDWLKARIILNDGSYQSILDTLLPFGGFNETFDVNDFNQHNWQMSGSAPWIITNEEAYTGNRSAQSGPITHGQSSSLSLTQTTPGTSISFYKKVSSEAGYDKMAFYIDNVKKDEWTGSVPWSQEKYPISQGTHTFTWTYTKDQSMSGGLDCVWVDDIIIEPGITPISYTGDTLIACKNTEVNVDCGYAYQYQNLEWTTTGDGHFIDSHAEHPIYVPGLQDNNNGGTTLYLNVDGSNKPLHLILTDEITLDDEILGENHIYPAETSYSHYSIEGQTGLDYIWQLEPADAGFLFPYHNTVDIVWHEGIYIEEALLTVIANGSCSQSLSTVIEINPLAISEQSTSPFTLYPNPTDGKVNLVLGQDLEGKSVIEVFDVLGTRITNKVLQNLTKGQTIEINLQHNVPGIYIVKLCNNEGCWSQKISVK